MSYTITIPNLPGGMTITCSAESQKEVIREAHFWQFLPTVCPLDGTPTIFSYREPAENSYYGVVSTGFPKYEYKIGQHKTGGTLFTKEEWVYFDGHTEAVLWSRGKLTLVGEQLVGQNTRKPTITEYQCNRLHQLGTQYYAGEWDEKRPELVSVVTKGAYTSSKDLLASEAQRLIEGLEKRISPARAETQKAA